MPLMTSTWNSIFACWREIKHGFVGDMRQNLFCEWRPMSVTPGDNLQQNRHKIIYNQKALKELKPPSEYQLSVEMKTVVNDKICGQWMPSQSIAQCVGVWQQQHTANELIQQRWYVIGSSKWYNQEKDKTSDAKKCFRFNVTLDTKYVISQMLFPANLLTSMRKQNQN